jgi:hypothetical protein
MPKSKEVSPCAPQVDDNVTVSAKAQSLPKIAAQYAGQTGKVVEIKPKMGVTLYRVLFKDGEAFYYGHELSIVVGDKEALTTRSK